MDELMEIITRRKSIRAYKDTRLPEGTVNAILEAARNAPTARNLQQLQYKVITNRELIKKISDSIGGVLKKEGEAGRFPDRPDFYYGAPLLIIIVGPEENNWIYSDAGLAAQNIMLYATSIGLGSCFIGMTRFIEKDRKILKELNISKGLKVAAAVVCGYADENPPPKAKMLNAEYFA